MFLNHEFLLHLICYISQQYLMWTIWNLRFRFIFLLQQEGPKKPQSILSLLSRGLNSLAGACSDLDIRIQSGQTLKCYNMANRLCKLEKCWESVYLNNLSVELLSLAPILWGLQQEGHGLGTQQDLAIRAYKFR